MTTRIVIIAAYLLAVVVLGLAARRRAGASPTDYFLAGRSLGGFVLIGTMAATNFSAFTVFGASGAGYRDGLAFYPIMGFGTGFMALTFWLVGRRAWRLGRRWSLVTPAELVGRVYQGRGSKTLAALFALTMVIFTVPYLALQPLAGGQVLHQLFGMSASTGAAIITLVIVLYTLRGGLRAVAWTDVLQGLMMLVLMVAALAVVAGGFGGWEEAFQRVQEQSPALMSRPGSRGVYTPAVWFSFMTLWFFCDPMFPQLFQRFYSAKSERDLGRTALVYPLICTAFFALPIALGVLGRLSFPDLDPKLTDQILPMLMTRHAGEVMGTLVLAAGLAALMSTMDSQLLTLSAMFSHDLYPLAAGRPPRGAAVGRVFVLVLAGAGLAVALTADTTILKLGLTAFTGLAVLFPTVLGGLWLDRPRPAAGLASIIVGEALVVGYHLGWLPAFGFLPAAPVMAASSLIYLIVHLGTGPVGLPRLDAGQWRALAAMAVIFALAQDYWRWGESDGLWLGWPMWAWWFVGLSLLQALLFYVWVLAPARAQAREAEGEPTGH